LYQNISAPYEKGIDVFKRHLRERLVLNKGDKPYTTKDIQMKLQKQWKNTGPWTMLSLGKGYYKFSFASENDLSYVWVLGMVSLESGVLRLFEWKNDFNLHNQHNTHAHV
jgi:hypothetical protein